MASLLLKFRFFQDNQTFRLSLKPPFLHSKSPIQPPKPFHRQNTLKSTFQIFLLILINSSWKINHFNEAKLGKRKKINFKRKKMVRNVCRLIPRVIVLDRYTAECASSPSQLCFFAPFQWIWVWRDDGWGMERTRRGLGAAPFDWT